MIAKARPNRPALRWHGGKFILADWIISHFPEHRVYVEPFGGAGSVLLRKPRSYAEVLNDISDDIYNLFWVIQNHYEDLVASLRITLFSRREFELAHVSHPNPIERARRLIIRSFQGFGGDSASNPERSTGFRHNSNRSGTTPAHDWVNYEQHLHQIADRMRGVVVENKDWRDILKSHDSEQSLFYLDPPYLPVTRKRVGAYKFEMTDKDHFDLLTAAINAKAKIVVSGYDSEMYNDMLTGWQRIEKKAMADGARERTEVLWIK